MDDLIAFLRARVSESFDEEVARAGDAYASHVTWLEDDGSDFDIDRAEADLRRVSLRYVDHPDYRADWQ